MKLKQIVKLILIIFVFQITVKVNAQSLIKAIKEKDTEKVKKIVSKCSLKKINRQHDKLGNSPLHIAVELNNSLYLDILINKEANVNIQNNDGNTPLMLAVKHDNFYNIESIFKKGPDLDLKNIEGKTVFNYIVSDNVRWLIGTEDYLKEYVININTLGKYHKRFPKSHHLKLLSVKIFKDLNNLDDLAQLKDLNLIIDDKIEKKAITYVTSIHTLKKFNTYFSKKHADDAILNLLPSINRSEICTILDLYPDCKIKSRIIKTYLDKSETFEQCIEAKDKFPALSIEAEKKALNYLSTIYHAITFKKNFAKSNNFDFILQKIYKTVLREDLPDLIDLFPNVNTVLKAKEYYISSSNNLQEYLDSVEKYSEYKIDIEQNCVQYTKTLSDSKLFVKTFGMDSINSTEVFYKVLNNLKSKEDVITLIDLFQQLSEENTLIGKKKYIDLCENINDCQIALQKFPDQSKTIEVKAYSLVKNIEECSKFLKYFSFSEYLEDVMSKTESILKREYNSCYHQIEDYQNFINKYEVYNNLYDPDNLLDKARQNIQNIKDYEKFIITCQEQADRAGSELMRCCSSWGGNRRKSTIEKDKCIVNEMTDEIRIPMTVIWYGSISGSKYWIKGILVISTTGRRWIKESDSGGFSPNCSKNCIR